VIELWRPHPDFNGRYEVSDQGNVRSLTMGSPRPLKVWVNKAGRRQVGPIAKFAGGPQKSYYVARLVLETFVKPCPPGMEAGHGPNGKSDDSVFNVYWITHSANMDADRLRDGILGQKLTLAKVLEIRRLRKEQNVPTAELQRRFNVGQPTIDAVIAGRTWDVLDGC
jgi:NUMOD4 motif